MMASEESMTSLQKPQESSPEDSSKSKDPKESAESAESALKDIKEQLQKEKIQHEKAVKELQEAIDILPESLKEPRETLREVTEKKLPQESQSEKLVTRSENLSDHEVLTWASGGLALQGIYQTTNITDLLGEREQLIQIPKGFKFCGPVQGSFLEKMEFSSSKDESTFRKTVEHLGLSFSLACKGELKTIIAETHGSYSRTSKHAKTLKTSTEHSYFCAAQYNYIPLALCHFSKDQLKLSSSALQELRKIEHLSRQISDNDKADLLKSRCGSFFKRFGSHVNSQVHLGGIFWWRASSEGFETTQLEEMKKRVQNVLGVYIAGCFSGQVGGIDFGGSKTDVSSNSTERKSSQTEIQLFVSKTGGPPEADSLTPWKSGLTASNKIWSVIDRGDEFIPIWDIVLSNHKEDFEDVLDISNHLREFYETLSGRKVSRICGEELIGMEKEVTAFLKGLSGWKITTDPDKLEELVNFKKKLYEKTKSEHMWRTICLSNPELQNFLERTVLLLKKDLIAPNISYMRLLLCLLLKPHIYSVQYFPSSSLIMQWIYRGENEQPEAISVTDIADFISILHEKKSGIKDALLKPSVSAAAEGEEDIVQISSDLSPAFCSLLKALRENSQEDLAHYCCSQLLIV
ncbi:interferon-induced very large GTPase 1-like [Sphaerodactylus townsendi]|uniref:interferon-induced very large GTPase 1-like n=1 Tax=Sphaerodactylus townsendi TaxID=933632 RepID=UPI0020275480|nr:interferon-induced very large GTPase 1-like [Sphaerodactylus townsendi]XP_048372396.1 interferon-induced very large GTPase 1-like [Sphaerodactylus townsendi]XP_048372403.1 interferon-induced very large GTPase 1-like [Sphaerodactylus townsendi]XP_048372409.1 interferon-induced very large GTPase 1-like [Sphaerodactylus townsendi]